MSSPNAGTEQEYVLKSFTDHFERYKDRPIALYGLGINTRVLLENIRGYHIVGLMDAERVGTYVMGHKVLSFEEVIGRVEIIVIVARKSVIGIIYERIKFLENKHHIAIYDIGGNPLRVTTQEENFSDQPYWDGREDQLLRLIDAHDIISFDIFDTLVTRKILRPQNIFDVIQHRLSKESRVFMEFKQARIEAEQALIDQSRICSLAEIYVVLQKKLKINDELRNWLLNMELETELRYVTPRTKMVETFKYALDHGKPVYLLSDMYLGKAFLETMLHKCNIKGYTDLLVSCDIQMTKEGGSLYDHYLRLVGKGKHLHIGDNSMADVSMAQQYMMDTFQVLSGYEMLTLSSVRNLLVNVNCLEADNILGLFVAKALNNPFALCASRGRPVFDDLFEMSYLCVAPIVWTFMKWFIKAIEGQGYEKLLFASRDGYLMHQLYDMTLKHTSIRGMPEGIYFKTSRRAATVAAINNEEDILFLLKKSFKCTLKHLLRSRFGIEPAQDDHRSETVVVSSSDGEKTKKYVLSYRDKILDNAREERDCYLEYIRGLGIMDSGKIGIFDLIASGTTQHFLSKLMQKDLMGFYFVATESPLGIHHENRLASFLKEPLFFYNPSSYVSQHYLLLEAIFTDSYGSLVRCNKQGDFCYADEKVALKNYDGILKCHNGIKSFFADMLALDPDMQAVNEGRKIADDIYGLLYQGRSIVSKSIKDAFYMENAYDFNEDFKLWDRLS